MATVTVFFATNRNPIGDPPTDFGPNLGPVGGANLRFGYADLDARTFALKSLTVAPERLFATLEEPEPKLGSREVFDLVRRKMAAHGRDTLVYVHGFDFTFREALARGAELKSFLAAGMNMFVVTWPSEGKKVPIVSYAEDRRDVEASGDAMGRAFIILARYMEALEAEDRCDYKIHVLAHSMGNYAFRHAVQGVLRRVGAYPPRLLDRVVLAAADEDNDSFEQDAKLKPLPRLCEHVTVYHTPSDRALTISETTKGNPERLGSDGPENSRLLNDRVAVVDVTPALAADGDATNHQYYRLNPVVRGDLRQVLDGVAPFEIKGRVYHPDTKRYRLTPGRRRPA
jgi:esterase/lipase superfamily enzyme